MAAGVKLKKKTTKHRVRRSYWHRLFWHSAPSSTPRWLACAAKSMVGCGEPIDFFFFHRVSHAPNQSSFPPPSPTPALRHVELQVVPKCSAHFVVDVILHNPCREKKGGKRENKSESEWWVSKSKIRCTSAQSYQSSDRVTQVLKMSANTM